MIILYFLVFAGIFVLSGSALIAFYWAVKDGQFINLREASNVIFDQDEPVGLTTDRFPDHQKRNRKS
ncbi:MAG: cbb3-type cytochrome oxidase assembly protein [Chthoniobacterales bacterium]